MGDEKPLKRKGRIEEFDDADVALVAGVHNPNGDLTFQDPNANGGVAVTLTDLTGVIVTFPDFTDLGDTPATYPGGTAGFSVVVNGTETGLEYVSLSAGTFLGLTDTPNSFAGHAGKRLAINGGETAIEFVDDADSWLGLTDTPGSFAGQAGLIPSVNAGETALEFSGGTADQLECAEAGSSGVLTPGDGVVTVENATQVRIAAGSAKIVTRVSGGTATCRTITWNDIVHTVANIAGPGASFAIEDPGVTGTGTVFETVAPLTSLQRRGRARLGASFHDGGAIEFAISAPDIWNDHIHLLQDALQTTENVRVLSGTASEIVSTFQMQTTDHVMFAQGIGFQGAGGFLKPNETEPVGSGNPRAFDLIAGDGTVFTQDTTAFVKQWNNGGSLTNLTGNRAVVHQVLVTVDGSWWVQAGTTNYSSFNDAVSNIGLEIATNPFWELAQALGSLQYVAVISNAASAWTPDLAELIPVGGGSGGGGSSFGIAAPSLSFAHGSNITLNATPQSPAWSIAFHPTVDSEHFIYPSVGTISNDEVEVVKKGMYLLTLDAVGEITSGSYFNPGASFYVNGVEKNGTQTSCAIDSCVNINHYSSTIQVELEASDLVTPGFLRFSGSGRLIGSRTHFTITFLRAT